MGPNSYQYSYPSIVTVWRTELEEEEESKRFEGVWRAL
jgi:hypothetical protein